MLVHSVKEVDQATARMGTAADPMGSAIADPAARYLRVELTVTPAADRGAGWRPDILALVGLDSTGRRDPQALVAFVGRRLLGAPRPDANGRDASPRDATGTAAIYTERRLAIGVHTAHSGALGLSYQGRILAQIQAPRPAPKRSADGTQERPLEAAAAALEELGFEVEVDEPSGPKLAAPASTMALEIGEPVLDAAHRRPPSRRVHVPDHRQAPIALSAPIRAPEVLIPPPPVPILTAARPGPPSPVQEAPSLALTDRHRAPNSAWRFPVEVVFDVYGQVRETFSVPPIEGIDVEAFAAVERRRAPERFGRHLIPPAGLPALAPGVRATLFEARYVYRIRLCRMDPPNLGFLANALTTAASLAREVKGLVRDVHTGRLLTYDQARAVLKSPAFDIEDHVLVGSTMAPNGTLRLRTRGNCKFGRPDLEMRGLPATAEAVGRLALLRLSDYLSGGAVLRPGETVQLGAGLLRVEHASEMDDADSRDEGPAPPVLALYDATANGGAPWPGLGRWLAAVLS